MSSEVLRAVEKDVIPNTTIAMGETFSFNPNTVIDPYDNEYIDFKFFVVDENKQSYGLFVASFNRIIPHSAPSSSSRLDWEYTFDGSMTIVTPSHIHVKEAVKLYMVDEENQPLMISPPYPSLVTRQHRYIIWTPYENDYLLENAPANVVPIRKNFSAPLTKNRRSMSSLRFKFE